MVVEALPDPACDEERVLAARMMIPVLIDPGIDRRVMRMELKMVGPSSQITFKADNPGNGQRPAEQREPVVKAPPDAPLLAELLLIRLAHHTRKMIRFAQWRNPISTGVIGGERLEARIDGVDHATVFGNQFVMVPPFQ